MPADALPARWRTESPAFNVPELIAELADCPTGSARHDLLIALQHARARAERDPWGSPEHVRYAQAVLEIAVEWAMPAVERWAVAWLSSAGVDYLRLRWSSRSRDGRTRRDGLAPSEICALTADSGRAIIGGEDGSLGQWTDEAGLSSLYHPAESEPALSAVACRGELAFAAGARGHVRTSPGSWTVPAPRENEELNAALLTAAITSGGDVACGDNVGRLLICPAGGNWLPPLRPPDDLGGSSIAALSFDGRSAVWAVWTNGWVTETRLGAAGGWTWHQPQQPRAKPVTAAAFDSTGQRAAIAYADGMVSVLHLREMTPVSCWPENSYRFARTKSVAWSPGGLLALSQEALAGASRLLFGQPDQHPEQISSGGSAGRVAFIDDDHLVRVRGREIADWAIHDAGSDVPDPVQHEITVVTVDPLDPGHTMVGTVHGGILRYDERGLATRLVADYGPVGGQVHELARMGDDWLIAAQSGAYRLTRAGEVSRLPGSAGSASYVCLSVTVTGQNGASPDGVYSCGNQVYTVSGEEVFTCPSPVRDVRGAPDGAVAAIDEDGSIRARDRSGARWSVADSRPRPGHPGRYGWRLLAADSDSATAWNPEGRSKKDPRREIRQFSRHGQAPSPVWLDPEVTAAVTLGTGVAAAYWDRGVALLDFGGETPGRLRAGVSTPATMIGGGRSRIVAAAGQRITGYDMMPGVGAADGSIVITVTGEADRFMITLPGGERTELNTGLVKKFGQISRPADEAMTSRAGDSFSELVDMASQIGDQLWRCGLDRALDLARGDDPDRPVRLIWHCDDRTDDLPWELVHPTLSPLGWFAEPPITGVRTVPRRGGPAAQAPAPPTGAPMTRYRMLTLRGTAAELAPSSETYVYTSRRTRLRNVRMLDPEPVVIKTQEDLNRALGEPVDILQVWAHCNRYRAEFSAGFQLDTGQLARQLAPRVSRLAVIIGCESGALARALVTQGVEAVVAMRTKVFSGTIQPLVTDLIALALGGMPIDLAFGQALHSYVLTGQPGAAAVPMLYLADGSTGELFR